MRVRKKKNTDKRLEQCLDILLNNDDSTMLNPSEIFDNNHELFIEIGCGKGGFVTQMATLNPQINFIAIEKIKEVIVTAAEKTKALELSNVRFINIDANLLNIKLPKNSISTIFLNFSDPWTKKRNFKRRLTDTRFLEIYKCLLTKDGELIQKTDNRELFEFSLNSLESNGFELIFTSYDLHSGDTSGNVVTEYEQKFIDEGKSIHKLIAKIKT